MPLISRFETFSCDADESEMMAAANRIAVENGLPCYARSFRRWDDDSVYPDRAYAEAALRSHPRKDGCVLYLLPAEGEDARREEELLRRWAREADGLAARAAAGIPGSSGEAFAGCPHCRSLISVAKWKIAGRERIRAERYDPMDGHGEVSALRRGAYLNRISVRCPVCGESFSDAGLLAEVDERMRSIEGICSELVDLRRVRSASGGQLGILAVFRMRC